MNPHNSIEEITWTCRFHPTDSFHEVGCPHKEWTKEDLQEALETRKCGEIISLKALTTN